MVECYQLSCDPGDLHNNSQPHNDDICDKIMFTNSAPLNIFERDTHINIHTHINRLTYKHSDIHTHTHINTHAGDPLTDVH